jgi:glycerol-3-phosphate dehydrogenase (NAD(P)+)
MYTDKKIAVLGGGSWATAIVKLLLNNRNQLNWFMRNYSTIEYIREYGHNPRYLSDVKIDTSSVVLCDDINRAVENADILIFAIPAAYLQSALDKLRRKDLADKYILSAIKGIVPEEDLIVGEYFNKRYKVPYDQIGIIAGPCHAEEVALERLSYLTIAAENEEFATYIAKDLKCRYMQTLISDDIFGTEYAAVLKNIFALAAGICNGLGYGDNFQAVLISNAIREMKRFADMVHPITRDIKDSAYLGDLIVTAYSKFSRNRTFGTMIGKGYSVKAAQLELGMVAEGYFAVKGIMHIKDSMEIDLPITEAVYNILYKRIPAVIAIKRLSGLLT